jgi:serine protease AprX
VLTLVQPTSNKSVITINGNSLDPTQVEDASGSHYVLIRTLTPLTIEQKREFAQHDLDVQEYVFENTCLYGYSGTDLNGIRDLPYVSNAIFYPQQFKIQPALKRGTSTTLSTRLPSPFADSRVSHTVDIVVHRDVDPKSSDLKKAVAEKARADETLMKVGRRNIRLVVQDRYLDDIASIDQVRVIQVVRQVTQRDDVARDILHPTQTSTAGITCKGEGEKVCVVDGCFDASHSTFGGQASYLDGPGLPAEDGHGTHVAGLVLTIAPNTQLVFQDLGYNDDGSLVNPYDLTELLLDAWDAGIRVHTNSWGNSSNTLGEQLPYGETDAKCIDTAVWEQKDLVVLFAAGNDAVDGNNSGIVSQGQIGSQAAAKNCITVGASESSRQEINTTYGSLMRGEVLRLSPRMMYWPDAFLDRTICDDQSAISPDKVAAFSSRGPTREKRFKPDVVAPGTSILSAWPLNLDPPSVFGESPTDGLAFMSGTSMATPLVAGCVAVLRQTLKRLKPGDDTYSPSAALIKALLINGAMELTDQYSPGWAGPCPNSSSGFGRVNLSHSIADVVDGNYLEHDDALEEGHKSKAIEIDIPKIARGATLKVTLAWTDPEGDQLQNDLDLIVTASNGTKRHGNMGTSKGYDRLNNVEQIHWTDMPPGTAQIVVQAYRITKYPQSFACAWSIRTGADPEET